MPNAQPLNEPSVEVRGTYVVPCECGQATCEERIELPAEAYDALAAAGQRVVHPLHVRRIDRGVARRSEGYLVVG